jgi:hypothetical protein
MYLLVLAFAMAMGIFTGWALVDFSANPSALAVAIGVLMYFGVMLPRAEGMTNKSATIMTGAVKTLLWQVGLSAIGFGTFVARSFGVFMENPDVAAFFVNLVVAILIGGLPYWIRQHSV